MKHSNKIVSHKEGNISAEEIKMVASESEMYVGPLPHPDHLFRYEEISPGAADRILRMAEEEQRHRHQFALEKLRTTAKISYIGVMTAFAIGMASIIIGGYVAVVGQEPAYGFAAILSALSALAGIFIYGKKQQDNQNKTTK